MYIKICRIVYDIHSYVRMSQIKLANYSACFGKPDHFSSSLA